MVESSKAVGPWREAVRAETQRAITETPAGRPTGGAVCVVIMFTLPRPRSHYGAGRNAGRIKESAPNFPAGRPDLDKLTRAVLDGLTAGGAWRDDAQVAELHASKEWGTPGCRIQIRQLEDER
jgi:crossover junction endodeoxyribonuclease RusA